MNCSFNIRYKPRTTRAFTKSDITVYDSAGNTALNALTVYGKSEVVDGEIVSAGDSGSVEVETCEKNLLDPTKLVTANITYTDGTLSGTAPSFSKAFRYGTPILFNNKRQVTFSVNAYTDGQDQQGRGLLFSFVYKDNTTDILNIPNSTIEPQFFTLTSNPAKQIQYISITYGVAEHNTWYLSKIQLEYGSSATAYEPYNGTMAVFETGTPLRGIPDTTVRDAMSWDGSSGEVTKNCAKVRLADLTWQYNDTKQRFHATLSNANLPILATAKANLLSSNYATKTWADFDESVFNKFIAGIQTFVGIRDTNYTTVSDFVASLGDAELVYELATPTTQNLTSTENASIAGLRTFEPQTYAQNNAGTDMTVDYTIRVPTI